MGTIPDLVGYPINEAIKLLQQKDLSYRVIESYGKTKVQTEDARVIRQRSISPKEIEIIISFF